MLVVDEEQRFGVTHKERLKQMSIGIDVLSMTATPIPRTLQMSLAGVRDLSVIETPPPGRMAIQTYLIPFRKNVLAQAIRQELRRGGQVFVVHNRIETLPALARAVTEMVPRGAGRHGPRPAARAPARTGDAATSSSTEADVLVTTTIIENGLDIPRANTIIVNRADRFGLAQLYQLRGRVGRSHQHAYAYFVVPCRHHLSDVARKRLRALQEFSELGRGIPAGRGRPGDPRRGGAAGAEAARPHRRARVRSVLPDARTGGAGDEGRAGRREASGQPAPRRRHQDPGELPSGIGRPAGRSTNGWPARATRRTSIGCRPRPRIASATCPPAGENLFDMGRLRILAERAGVKSDRPGRGQAADPIPRPAADRAHQGDRDHRARARIAETVRRRLAPGAAPRSGPDRGRQFVAPEDVVKQPIVIRWILLLLLLGGAIACKGSPTDPLQRPAALVGGQPVYLDDVEKYFESNLIEDDSAYSLSRETMDQVKSRLLDALIEERMLYVEAERREISVTDRELEAYLDMGGGETPDDPEQRALREGEARQRLMVQKLQEQVIQEQDPPSEDEVAEYAAEHGARLLPAQPLELRALQLESLEQAKRVHNDIRRKRITFNEAALVHDPSPGQALPMQMSWDSLSSELREALKDLKPGQISEPLELHGSIYLFQVGTWLNDPADQDVELLRRARLELESNRRRDALERLLASLRQQSGVRIMPENLPFTYTPADLEGPDPR